MLIVEYKQTLDLQHPTPQPQHHFASFLDPRDDPVQPGSGTESEQSSVLESLESVATGRDSRYQSESRDANVSAVPTTTPASAGPSAQTYSDGASTPPSNATRSTPTLPLIGLVDNPFYRRLYLAPNNIRLLPLRAQLPDNITRLLYQVRRERGSPGPSPEDVLQDEQLKELWMGTGEPEVEAFFKSKICPGPTRADGLKRSERMPVTKHSVPSTGSEFKISHPIPVMLYGYVPETALPNHQALLVAMTTEPAANVEDVMYPFLVVECQADGPTGAASLWAATNSCQGGAASCVKIADKLNHRLSQRGNSMARPIDNAAFSIAMTGTEARLYVSWKGSDSIYNMASIDSFLLQKPRDCIEFRRYVRNIIDWGKGDRLEDIRNSLDILVHESQKGTSQMPLSVRSSESPSGV